MSEQEQEKRKHKPKRPLPSTYEELLKQGRDLNSKSCKVYVRQMCKALKAQYYSDIDIFNPDHADKIKAMRREIQDRIRRDCKWWPRPSIRRSMPDWMKIPLHSILTKAGLHAKITFKTERSLAQIDAIDAAEFSILELARKKITPLPKEEESDLSQTDTGERELTAQELNDQFFKHASGIWRVSTGLGDKYPSTMMDVFVELVKPSRKYWSKIMDGITDQGLTTTYNELVWLKMLIEDRLDLTEEIHRQRIGKTTKNV